MGARAIAGVLLFAPAFACTACTFESPLETIAGDASDAGSADIGPDTGSDAGDADSGPRDAAPDAGDASATPDADASAAPDADGGPPSLACIDDWFGALHFDPAQPIAELNTPLDDRAPFLSADLQTIYFASTRSGGLGGLDLWFAVRAGAAFGPAMNGSLLGLNTGDDESRLSLSRDGLTAYVGSTRTGGRGMSDIWMGTRLFDTIPFTGFAPVTGVSSTRGEIDPFASADGHAIFYAGGFTGGLGHTELILADRTSTSAPFGNARLLVELNSSATETGPALSADLRVIVFASNRTTPQSKLWFATRSTAGAGFSAPALVPELAGPAADTDPFLSPDGCELFFARDVGGAFDLFHARVHR